MKRILVSMSAYNEEASIGRVITEIKSVLSNIEYPFGIQVIDDHSVDDTQKIAIEFGAKVYLNINQKGLIYSFKEELNQFLLSNSSYFIHIDADGQYDPSAISIMVKLLDDGYDLVLGSRFIGEIEDMTIMKRFGNIAFSKLYSLLTGIHLTDSTTGFRAFNRQVASKIKFVNTFTYTQEQILKAAYLNLKIIEVPVKSRATRSSHLFRSPFEYALKAFVNLFRIYFYLMFSNKSSIQK